MDDWDRSIFASKILFWLLVIPDTTSHHGSGGPSAFCGGVEEVLDSGASSNFTFKAGSGGSTDAGEVGSGGAKAGKAGNGGGDEAGAAGNGGGNKAIPVV